MLFKVLLVTFATAVALSSAVSTPPRFDGLFCDALKNPKVQACVSEKWIALRLDQTPDNICQALVKEWWYPCLSEEQRRCLDTNGDFEHIIKAVRRDLPHHVQEECYRQNGNGATVAKLSYVAFSAFFGLMYFM